MSDKYPIGHFAKIRRGASPRPIGASKYFGGEVGWVRISDVTNSKKYLRKTNQYVSPLGESLSVRVDKGDIIMSICGTIGKPIIIDMPACIHDGFVQFYNINGLDTDYLYYILQFHEKNFELKGQPGTQLNLNTTIVEDFLIFAPKPKEQKNIASILSSIDNVIEQTAAAIEKHKAIKQGMMHDLLNRGIDIKTGKLRPKHKDAPELYKESEMGIIPKEWDTTTISKSTFIKGRIGWHGLKSDEFIDEGPYLITGTDFIEGKIHWSNCYHITSKRFSEDPHIHLQNDDLLITKDGSIGKTAVVENKPSEATLNSGIFLLRCIDGSYYNKFLYFILNYELFFKFLRKTQGGSTINHLYQGEFEKFTFPIPLKDEQTLIIDRINSIDKKIEQELDYLLKHKNIKQGLMQDLLTGKKPVKINEDELTLKV